VLIQPINRKEFIERTFPYPYSYMVYQESGIYYVKDGHTGMIMYNSSNASDVIQYAIDNAPDDSTVIVVGTVTLDNTVVVSKRIRLVMDKVICKASANPCIQLGTENTYVEGGILEFTYMTGDNKQNNGILFKNWGGGLVRFGKMELFDRALYFDTTNAAGAGENKVYFGVIRWSNYGIYFENVNKWMEGNRFEGSIFGCNYGIYTQGASKFTLFIGVIDNVEVSDSYDIYDLAGGGIYIMYFVRMGRSVYQRSTLIYAANYGAFFGRGLAVSAPGKAVDAKPDGTLTIQSDSSPVGPVLILRHPQYDLWWIDARNDNKNLEFLLGGSTPVMYLRGSDGALRLDVVKFDSGSYNIATGDTQTLPAGFYYVSLGPNTVLEVYNSATGVWETALLAGGKGFIASDGSNVRLRNTGTATETSYYYRVL